MQLSRFFLILLIGFFLTSSSLFPLAAQTAAGERVFYTTEQEDSFRSFERNAQYIDIVGPQCLKVDENGIIWGSVDKRLLSVAKKNNVKVIALLINPGFNLEMLHKLLLSPTAQERAVTTLVELCRKDNLHGIQFDFENIHITDRDAYTAFFKRAADSLHKYGFNISIAIVPRAGDFGGAGGDYQKWMFEYWRGGYDLKALGQIADFVSYMTYDQHTRRTTPGPVAGFAWIEDCLAFALKSIPKEKLSLGLALYCDYWFPGFQNPQQITASGRSLVYEDAVAMMESMSGRMEWHERDKVNYTIFERDYLYEYIFFENARSFQARLELVKKHGLRGISCWRLGQEDSAVFKTLQPKR
jgi:spore germination protein